LGKYIPFTMVVMTIALPGWLATRPRPKRALRLLRGWFAVYIVIWAYLCLHVYTQYVFIE